MGIVLQSHFVPLRDDWPSINVTVFSIIFGTLVYLNTFLLTVDTKLIERKRQDTLEICRIFNEENNYHNNNNAAYVDYNKYIDPKRVKRNIGKSQQDTSVLDREDIVRVENIVDKLYDDVEQIGSKVTYRRRVLENPAKKKVGMSNIMYVYQGFPTFS